MARCSIFSVQKSFLWIFFRIFPWFLSSLTWLDLNPTIRSWTIHCPGIPRFRGLPTFGNQKIWGQWIIRIISHFFQKKFRIWAKTMLRHFETDFELNNFDWQVQPCSHPKLLILLTAWHRSTAWCLTGARHLRNLPFHVRGRKKGLTHHTLWLCQRTEGHFSCFASRNPAPKFA